MKIILWVYSVIGSLYFLMYFAGNEAVVKYAVGLFWLLMMVAPVVLLTLVVLPLVGRLGLFKK